MAQAVVTPSGSINDITRPGGYLPVEAHRSGVSWAAVIAGAFVAASLSVALLTLGAGLGLSSISPWANDGASAKTLGIAAVIWVIVMHIIAFGLGGYLAGRLRTKWVDVHTDEVFFRDTAHGFLVWAVGIVISASILASAASSIIGGAAKTGVTAIAMGGAAAGAVAAKDGTNGASLADQANTYFTDMLLRQDTPSKDAGDASVRAEAGRIFVRGITQDQFPAADRTYLAKQIAARTGISQAEAEKRVDDVIAQAKKLETDARAAADTARKAAVKTALLTFLALLIGAFCASYAATIGGRQRDHVIA